MEPPEQLVPFFQRTGDTTVFTTDLRFIYHSMVKEFFIAYYSIADRAKTPAKFNTNEENYWDLTREIEKWRKENDKWRLLKAGIASENFLVDICHLCKPADVNSIENLDGIEGTRKNKKTLGLTYEFLDHYLSNVAKDKRFNGDYWIKQLETSKKVAKLQETSMSIPVYTGILGLNFTQVFIPIEYSVSAERFYSGYSISFSDLKSEFDFERNVYIDPKGVKYLIQQHFQQTQSSYIALKGVAGSGKSTLLKRIAYDLAMDSRPVFVLDLDWWESHYTEKLQVQIKSLIENISGVIIIIDGIATCIIKEELNLQSLLEFAQDRNSLFIFSEQPDRWNIVKDKIRILDANNRFYTIPLSRLDEDECGRLVDKLYYLEEKSFLLPRNSSLTREERLTICVKSADRHFVVAMLQSRFGKRFSEIIAEEFENIPSKLGKEAYLLVSFWHNWNMGLPESLLWDSLNLEATLDYSEVKLTTEFLIENTNRGYFTRHHVVAKEVCRNFINGKSQNYFQLKRTFTYINDSKAVKSFLKDFFNRTDSHRIIINALEKDAVLLKHLIDFILTFKKTFDKDLLKDVLSCYAKAEHILGNYDNALEIFKTIIAEVDETYSFAYRQIAWIETDSGNATDAIDYAIRSADYSSDPSHTIQIAKILSLNTISSFYKADKYYQEAIRLSDDIERYQSEYNKYLEAMEILRLFTGVMEDEFVPTEVVKALKPNLQFLKVYFGPRSKEYQKALLSKLHFMEADISGKLEDVEDIMADYDINKNSLVKSKYYSNIARVKFLEWRSSNGVTSTDGIIDDFNTGINLNPKDPFTHCWLGTYYKEVERDYRLAEIEYQAAIDLSKNAEHWFDKDHPIFSNNKALLIMDEVIEGKLNKKELHEAKELLIFATKMNELKGRQFFWAEESLSKCLYLIEKMGA